MKSPTMTQHEIAELKTRMEISTEEYKDRLGLSQAIAELRPQLEEMFARGMSTRDVASGGPLGDGQRAQRVR